MVMDYLKKKGFYMLMLKNFDVMTIRIYAPKFRCDHNPKTQLWHSVYYVCMAYTR